VSRSRARSVRLECLDGTPKLADALVRHKRSDELIVRKRQQIRNPIARSLKQSLDPSSKGRDDMAPSKARVARA
jgi:hypothetical protein